MNTLLLIGGIGMQEILVIALIVLLLFGGKKIPELMKGIGKGVRSFKDGVNGLEKEIDNDESTHRNPKDNEPSK
ncbi:MAG TPA: twin-arginine translocase TatA/TatE family subunit [Porphyromonadaceae bacterium]|jgi:sec-independent protein translocase protein TatA|nr:twin-arginine translocase TatA/TatE family subunit [Coprobacter sp.]CDA21387.1 sec-independent protein translocase protein TatA 2 [Bacteroides sp. CAG:144]HCZ20268.1 twin-arginine translocase TatA/TatE family subunit [Porphyromonadaceae bacterium]